MDDAIVQELVDAGIPANDVADELSPIYAKMMTQLYGCQVDGRTLAAFWYLLHSDEMKAAGRDDLQGKNVDRAIRQLHMLISELRE
jgi:hypothetical protein